MPVNVRIDGNVVILSNFGRLMNDPRYVDASRDAGDLLEQGLRNFVIDLGGVRETGGGFLGLLMTITRLIRRHGGDAVLAHAGPEVEDFIMMMQMDDYWDVFDSAEEAKDFFGRRLKAARSEGPA
jgi:anti-anti-sigma regulatory factor